MKREIKRVEKLLKKGYILILSGNDIISLYNAEEKKEYIPKYRLEVVR